MLLAANPFVNAYLQSDWFGKGIFWALFLLSALSWSVLIYKVYQLIQIRRLSREFAALFAEEKNQPLHFQFNRPPASALVYCPHPFFEVYKTAKQNALQLLKQETLSLPDLELVGSQTAAAAAAQSQFLEKHLFILSTIMTLGPFLGLLGTVWGILLTFNQLPLGFSSSNTSLLSGLSMALATTVIGLVVAIPALVGYNYLKNANREYKKELEHFTHFLLGSVEMHYRKNDA